MGVAEQTNKTVDEVWEDQRFVHLHRQMFNEYDGQGGFINDAWRFPRPVITDVLAQQWADLAQERNRASLGHWGFKDPRFPFVMDFGIKTLAELGIEPLIVWMSRAPHAIVKSLQVRDGETMTFQQQVVDVQLDQWSLMRRLHGDLPSVSINYEDLVITPFAVASKLANMLGVTSHEQIINSVAHVRVRKFST